MKAALSQATGNGKALDDTQDRSHAPAWDRGNLEEWRASLSPERRAQDAEKLSRIFNLAAKVPELRDALEWAKDHGIEFIVDRQAAAGGYYTIGTGVVAIVEASFETDRRAVNVMVHEIRHAWQDWYGMVPTTGKNFTGYFITLGVVEADAMAHGNLAERQFTYAGAIEHIEKYASISPDEKNLAFYKEKLRESLTSTEQLWKDFQGWYTSRARTYGTAAIKWIGERLGVPDVYKQDIRTEYRPYEGRKVPKIPGVDVTRHEELRRLGKGFRGGNYLNHARREVLDRQILSPGRAASLYLGFNPKGSPSRPATPLANEIRKRELLLKRHKGKAELI